MVFQNSVVFCGGTDAVFIELKNKNTPQYVQPENICYLILALLFHFT